MNIKSSDFSEESYIYEENKLDFVEEISEDNKGSKWLELFLQNSSNQQLKTEEILKDVDDTFQIINKNLSNTQNLTLNKTLIDDSIDEFEDESHLLEKYENPEFEMYVNGLGIYKSHCIYDNNLLDDMKQIEERIEDRQSKINQIILHSQNEETSINKMNLEIRAAIDEIENDRKKEEIKLIESVKIEKDKLNQLQAEKINLKSKKQLKNAVKIQVIRI